MKFRFIQHSWQRKSETEEVIFVPQSKEKYRKNIFGFSKMLTISSFLDIDDFHENIRKWDKNKKFIVSNS